MNPSHEEALFALALEKRADKRPAFLDAVCDGDATLRQRLEALLAAHEQPETLLATQAATMTALANMAQLYEKAGRTAEAQALRRELAALKAKAENQKPDPGQTRVAPSKR